MQADRKTTHTYPSQCPKDLGPGNLKTPLVEAIAIRDSPESLPLEILKIKLWNLAGQTPSFGFGWEVGLQQDQTMHIFTFLGGSMGFEPKLRNYQVLKIWCCHCKYLEIIGWQPEKEWITSKAGNILFLNQACLTHNTMKDLDIDRPVFIPRALRWSFALCQSKGAWARWMTKALLQWIWRPWVKRRKMENQRVPWRKMRRWLVGLILVPDDSFEDQLNGLRKGFKVCGLSGNHLSQKMPLDQKMTIRLVSKTLW